MIKGRKERMLPGVLLVVVSILLLIQWIGMVETKELTIEASSGHSWIPEIHRKHTLEWSWTSDGPLDFELSSGPEDGPESVDVILKNGTSAEGRIRGGEDTHLNFTYWNNGLEPIDLSIRLDYRYSFLGSSILLLSLITIIVVIVVLIRIERKARARPSADD
jgi:hypothetical protein